MNFQNVSESVFYKAIMDDTEIKINVSSCPQFNLHAANFTILSFDLAHLAH